MREFEVQNTADALAYITDCNLATVWRMAMLKSRKRGDFERQISIAQKAVDWMYAYGIDMSTTRAKKVVDGFNRSVEKWAKQYMDMD